MIRVLLILLILSVPSYAAFDCDGVDTIVMADNSVLDLPNGDWYIGGWVKADSMTGTKTQYVFETDNKTGLSDPRIQLYFLEDSNSWQPNEYGVTLLDNDLTIYEPFEDNNAFQNNTSWTYMGLRKHGDVFDKFIDGTSVYSSTKTGINAITVITNPAFCRNSGARLAEWAFWDVALTDAQVSALAEGFAPTCFQNNLKWYMPMVRSYSEYLNNVLITNNGSVVSSHPRISECY